MILVIGGHSKIGSALIEELVARGEAVQALVRSHENAAFPDGVDAIAGDLGDPTSLDRAMAEADRVFLLCGPNEHEVTLNTNAIDAAKRAGVDLLVRSSILGADPDSPCTFVRHHGECDAYLNESGVPHAIVRPNLFMQNIPESTIPSIDTDGNFYANAGDSRLSMVDTRDVAAVAAELITNAQRAPTTVDVTGAEALSYADVATTLSKTLGRGTITYVEAPDDAIRQALLGMSLGEWMANSLVELFQEYKRSGPDGYAARVTDAVQQLTGRRPRTLDQLLAEGRD